MCLSAKLIATLYVSILAAASLGQNAAPCLQRTLIASVVDEQGITPPNLTRENFRIAYKGQSASPLSAVYTKVAPRLVVLLDASESMKARWGIARAVAWELVVALPDNLKASLMTFSEKVESRTPMSLDRKPIHDWLSAASGGAAVHGYTALYAAIQSAIEQLQPAQPGDAIYVISDGEENASRPSKSKVVDALVSGGIRLFTLTISSQGFLTPEEQAGAEDLRQATEDSGGITKELGLRKATGYSPKVQLDNPTVSAIRQHSQQFVQAITAFYSITVALPENPDKPQHIELAVVNAQGNKDKNLFASYSHKVFPCAGDLVKR
jgi:hypothetical protein